MFVLLLTAAALLAAAASSAVAAPGQPEALPECSANSLSAPPAFQRQATPEVRSFPDGGSKHTYSVEGGEELVSFGQPPARFNPMRASDAELQRYGFPPRPHDAEALVQWRELVGDFKKAAAPGGCTGEISPIPGAPPEPVTYDPNVHVSQNWSGYMANAPGNRNQWHAVVGNFYQPSGTAHNSCQSNALLASWVGLGGHNTGALIQVGTTATTSGGYGAWVEYIAGETFHIINLPLSFTAGNYMRLYAGYDRSAKTGYFYITNDWTKETILTTISPMSENYYDGSSGQLINERPGNGMGGRYPLLNYHHADWYDGTVQNSADQIVRIGSTNVLKVQMRNNGSSLLSNPGALWNTGNFTNYYFYCK